MKFNLFSKAFVAAIIAFTLSYAFYQYSGDFLNSSLPKGFMHYTKILGYRTFDQSISLKNINTVNIETLNTSVYIKHTNSDGKIEFTSGVDQEKSFEAKKSDSQLYLNLNELSDYQHSSITILLPNNVKVVTIATRSGGISIEKVQLKTLSIKTASGNINLNDITLSEAKLTANSGNVNAIGVIKNLVTKTQSGNVKVNSSYVSPNYIMTSVSGNINLTFSTLINSKLDLQSVNGKVLINKKLLLNENQTKDSPAVHVRSVNGNIQVSGGALN